MFTDYMVEKVSLLGNVFAYKAHKVYISLTT